MEFCFKHCCYFRSYLGCLNCVWNCICRTQVLQLFPEAQKEQWMVHVTTSRKPDSGGVRYGSTVLASEECVVHRKRSCSSVPLLQCKYLYYCHCTEGANKRELIYHMRAVVHVGVHCECKKDGCCSWPICTARFPVYPCRSRKCVNRLPALLLSF